MSFSVKQIFFIALFFHILASIFSSGFHHFDEHFQIYEFLNYKLGKTPLNALPWEFHSKVRPWIQIYFYLVPYKIFSFLGVESPFIHAFIFRLMTSLLGLFATFSLVGVLKLWFPKNRNFYLALLLLNFSWFVPYIHTRTNSEGFAASFFLFGLGLWGTRLVGSNEVQNKTQLRSFLEGGLIGLLWGVSFLARSQMGFVVMFSWFWGVFFGKGRKLSLAMSCSIGIIIAFGLGVALDSSGYGEPWVITQINYVRTNFMEGKLASGTIKPMWYYITASFGRGVPPISIVLIVSTFWMWLRRPFHLLTWSTLPLFVVHSLIGHKEPRYLMPVFLMSPLALALMISQYREKFDQVVKKKFVKIVLAFVLILNAFLLVASSLRPANPSVDFYSFLHNNPNIAHFYAVEDNPFTMVSLPVIFYRPSWLEVEDIKDFDSIPKDKVFNVFFHKGERIFEMEKNNYCKNLYMAYPRFSINFNYFNWMSRSRVWSLYQCDYTSK